MAASAADDLGRIGALKHHGVASDFITFLDRFGDRAFRVDDNGVEILVLPVWAIN
ncbi:hypothetical protein [Paracoccus versutus]|uniref:hypothetical protein n=1 Tax=Paracoccus versutus TaxID=34007 RepID=UPI0012EE4DDD|nr:hypothetical protein [Paracoccus versutus]